MKIRWLFLAALCLAYYVYVRNTADLAMSRFSSIERTYANVLENHSAITEVAQP